MTATPAPVALPRAARRLELLRPGRTRIRLLEAKLARERFVNAGLRARLAELTIEHTATLRAIESATDKTARHLGHKHPAVTSVRAILEQARP